VNQLRARLPQLSDRLPLGGSGHFVSPLCLGITGDPRTVLAAYELGVNFFFLSADLHWPIYEYTRRGLAQLFLARPGSRERVVVAVISYLSGPLFGALQFHEVIDAVPGLRWVDLLLAGAVSGDSDCTPRLESLAAAKRRGHLGARSIGATFHSRPHALESAKAGTVDIAYIRYNTRHPGARRDVLLLLAQNGRSAPLIFGFKSTMFQVTDQALALAGLGLAPWRPHVTDYYRFALSAPRMNGVLASPMSPSEIVQIHQALASGALTPEEEEYMLQLTGLVFPAQPKAPHPSDRGAAGR
jgi:hypothetical protein